MKRTVLLTGSRGFTGLHVRSILEHNGFEVIGLVRANAQPNEVAVSLSDLAALRTIVAQTAPDYVIHLASYSSILNNDLKEFYDTNIFGTLNLLQALYDEKIAVKNIVISSSANIYGNPATSSIDENTPPAPINHYSVSKLGMEHMARTWLDRLPIVLARPFNYTGVGQKNHFLIPKIVAHFARRASVIELGNLHVEREFNDVRMVAQAYLGLMQTAAAGNTFNICTGRGYRLQEVIQTCMSLTGYKDMRININPHLVRENELKTLVGNPTRLNKQLPNLTSYTIEDTLRWMLHHANAS
ncbi:MAG: GDP-mannose 4,6-dehydratase [Formosimonas sp.]